MNRLLGIGLSFLFIALLAGCKNQAATEPDRFDSGTLHISCDESFKPVIDAQIQVYEAEYPKTKIIAHYKPEAECIKDFLVDSIRLIIATLGVSVREKKIISDSLNTEAEALTIAYDAIAVVVNKNATDSSFTLSDIKELVTGSSKKNLIPVFDGLKATSTVRFMLDSVLRGQELGKNVVAAENSRGVLDYVARTTNAVGFVGVSWIGNNDDSVQRFYLTKVRIARLESADSPGRYVLPVQYLIYTRSYPLIRDLVYVLKEKHIGLAHGFALFLRKDRGQLIFRRAYLLPALRPFYNRDTEL